MFLAAVHLPLTLTLPVALVIAAALAWYWRMLSKDDVPLSRRKVRRFSLVIMFIALPVIVGALSVIDPTPVQATANDANSAAKRQYAVAWTLVMFLVLVLIATALMDAINNLRILQNQKHEEVVKAAAELAVAIRERQRAAGDGASASSKDATESTA